MARQEKKQHAQTQVQSIDIRHWRFQLTCLLLALLVIMSALGVIYSSYKSRQLFSDVQQQYAKALQLEEQWGRLLLEQSTWASHVRIEKLAKTKLSMTVPDPSATVVVKE